MFLERVIFRYFCKRNDKRRKARARVPDGVERRADIPYGKHGMWNLLDVYYPKNYLKDVTKPLPTIVNVHGGGYVYGTKEESRFYCMDLARRGFAVVNFNYRLVPAVSFPVPVLEANQVMEWVCANASEYFIDLGNVFMVGDSAGAQIASQYVAMATNPAYAELFGLEIPPVQLKAVALNCGMYEKFHEMKRPMLNMLKGYFGKTSDVHGELLDVLGHITKDYPPAFVMTANKDFLFSCSLPLYERLQSLGVESVYKVFGSKENPLKHVFHIDTSLDMAHECNDEQAAFFLGHVK